MALRNNKKNENNRTLAFQYYDLGRMYNNRLTPNQYTTVNTNIEFYIGNQWLHLPESPSMQRLPRPVFNIIKRIVQLFVASLTATNSTIEFQPLEYFSGDPKHPEENPAMYATAEVRNLLEKFKMDYRIRDALTDGAITGDYCAHFFWNPEASPYGNAYGDIKGEIQMELVDGINVMFGNPNTTDVEKQPYILIVGRDTVDRLKSEAYANGASELEAESIVPDVEFRDQSGVGGKTELHGQDDRSNKALYVYLYTKVTKEVDAVDKDGNPIMTNALDSDGKPIPEKMGDSIVVDEQGNTIYKQVQAKLMETSVHVTKATRTCNIFEDVDTGMSVYPIAWANWEKQKNQYHGRALVTGIVPNQIYINSMMAMAFLHEQLMSFPKVVYNADLLPQWNADPGVAIGLHNLLPGQALRDVATIIQPADMSNQVANTIDRVMTYTKDCLGATDAQLGSVSPENTSALMVLQSASEVPLENIRAGLHEWLEDCGRILLDMMGTYYNERPIFRDKDFEEPVMGSDGAPLLDPMTGQMMTQKVSHRVMEDYDFRIFKNLWFNVRADAGSTSQYSEISRVQTLDNLRREGMLTPIQYFERIPDKLVPRKQELIDTYKQSMAEAQSQMPMPEQKTTGNAGPAMGGMLDADKTVASMPTNIQAKYNDLPNKAKNALVKKESMKNK